MTYLLFGGGMSMVLLGFIWFAQPEQKAINRYMFAMYLATGLIVLYSWAERSGIIMKIYLLYNMQIPLCYLFAPLLYYGFSQLTDLDRKPAAPFTPHFLPAIVSAPAILAVNIMNPAAFAGLSANTAPLELQKIPVFFAVHLLGLGSNLYIVYFLTRIIITGLRFFRNANLETVKELRILLGFMGMFYLDIVLMSAAHLLKNVDLVHGAKILSSATFIFYAFFSFRYPEYAQQVIRRAKQIRYKNTQLRGLNTDVLLERLDYLMDKEKISRSMELSLASLSAQLMVTPHQLSEILNERLHLNFSSFLNGYRVRDAERLLAQRPESSIIEIAFEVGFSSKASFNEHFRKVTGLSPSDYRKRRSDVPKRRPIGNPTVAMEVHRSADGPVSSR